MWPSNSVLIIISASVFLVHSLPPNIVLSSVQDDSNSTVQNEKYLKLFLQLATRTADRLIHLRNQADKSHDCNRLRDNLSSTLENPRTQSPFDANSERSSETTQDDIQTQLFSSKTEDTTPIVVRNDEMSSFGTTQKSVFNSDTENVTTSANESNSDAQSLEVDGIAERFFNPFNLPTLHASAPINDLANTEKKVFAQTHKLLQSTLEKSKQLINNTLCLQYAQKPPSKIDNMNKMRLDLPLDNVQENVLNPQNISRPSVLKQIVSSAINVVKSVIEKLPASVNNAIFFKQIIPFNLEKLQASLNNATLFDQIISRNLTNNIPLQIAEESRKSPEGILKSSLEFMSALRSRVTHNEFGSQLHFNQSFAESNSEVIESVDKTNTIEKDNQETSTEFTHNSEIQSNNGQSTPTSFVNHESTLAPLSTLLTNFNDDKNRTERFNDAQNNSQNSENVTNVEIPEALKENDSSNNTKHRPTSSHIDNNQPEVDNHTRLIEKLEQIEEPQDDLSKTTLQNMDDQLLNALRPVTDTTDMNSDRP